jgi:hypothetical protein
VPAAVVGRVGGDRVALGGADVPLETVRAAHAGGFARMMGEDGERIAQLAGQFGLQLLGANPLKG